MYILMYYYYQANNEPPIVFSVTIVNLATHAALVKSLLLRHRNFLETSFIFIQKNGGFRFK